ncbi:MAG: type II toxin-antitoxin system VapC family toxin [Alphaproteobacteria bacterium]|uniref:Type II toxin-antitoxin system VapC family toxin n=1 Tax=Candidatus Nitrobium versatile TaxID=2884831 RepID=A0A953M0W1_9BACT|nr:type II toxin-antitoxin system VapC family toxin [Candidatus Nitrobium versatile]
MNLVDSCGWLEYLADGPNADFFAGPLENQEKLLVPTICITEVFKRVLQQRGEDAALHAAALMQQGNVVALDSAIAVEAARLGHKHTIPLADGIILATAYMHKAVIWTQDADFKGLKDVEYKEKQ